MYNGHARVLVRVLVQRRVMTGLADSGVTVSPTMGAGVVHLYIRLLIIFF